MNLQHDFPGYVANDIGSCARYLDGEPEGKHNIVKFSEINYASAQFSGSSVIFVEVHLITICF